MRRPVFSVMRASFRPLPSPQRRFSFGTRTFVEPDDAVLDRLQAHEVAADDDLDAGPALLDDEGRDLLRVRVTRHDDEEARPPCRSCTRASRRSRRSRPRACARTSSRGSRDRIRRAAPSARTPRSPPSRGAGGTSSSAPACRRASGAAARRSTGAPREATTRLPSRLVMSFIASPYSRCVSPRPPYSFGIFIPNAPSSARRCDDARRDLALAVDRVRSRPPRRGSARASLMKSRNSGRSGGASGNGWTRSRRKLPEEDLLQEGRSLPLGLPGLLGDPAGLGGADGAGLRLRHELVHFTTAPLPIDWIALGQQVPVLRRAARPRVREMFSRIAWRYDLVNDVMSFGLHRRWKRQTAELALSGAPDRARRASWTSAAAPGTSASWPKSCGARSRRRRGLHAPDARRRARRAGASAGTAERASCRPTRSRCRFPTAPSTPSRSATACATSPTSTRPSREMRRVLAPGGRAVVLDFGKPDNPLAGGALPRVPRAR